MIWLFMKLQVKVHANFSQEKIERRGRTIFEVWLTESPVDGKANFKLLSLMRKEFKGKTIRILSGFTGRKKVLEVLGD